MKHKYILIFFLLFLILSANILAQDKPTYLIEVKRADTLLGNVNIELFPNIAPKHVANFDSLVSYKFFDSTAFHRVIPGFVIQGGDPNSRSGPRSTWGEGQPNQPTVNAEFSIVSHLRGILSAARSADTNSASSQFFICVAPATWLNGEYSVYGRVTQGMNIVDIIVNAPRDVNDNPLVKIEMFITRTGANPQVPPAPILTSPANGLTNVANSKLFRWEAVSDAVIYTLEISVDSLFSNFFLKRNVSGVSSVVTGFGQTGIKYFWRVKANNGGYENDSSEVRSFTTAGGTTSILPQGDFSISPDPDNNLLLLTNSDHLISDSRFILYDMTGKIVYQQKIQKQFSGNSLKVKLPFLKNGLYLCQLSSGKISLSKKIIWVSL